MKEELKESRLGKIPESWEVLHLEQVCLPKQGMRRGPFGGAIKKAFFVEQGYQVYEQRNAIYDNFDSVRYFIDEEKFNELKAFQVEANDFIVSCSGTIGKIAKVPENFKKGVINQALLRLRLNRELISDNYFLQQFRSKPFQNKITDSTQGGAMRNLVGMSDFRKTLITIPPLTEQQKIAKILSTVDAKIEVIDQQITETQELKKGLMQRLLTKGIGHTEFKDSHLGKIPMNWEFVPIYELRNKDDRYGFTGGPFGSDLKSEHYTEKGVQVLQLQNIGEGKFLNKSQIFTSEEKADELKSCNIYPDDIILAKMAPVARSCKIPSLRSRYLMGSDGIRLSIDKSKYDNEFIFQALNSKYFRDEATSKSTGTTRARIGLKDLKLIPLLVPNDIQEQKKLANILSTVDSKLGVLSEKKTNYQELKNGLMQQLLTGKVRVKLD
jgi:type I restriction enzyme S subunit